MHILRRAEVERRVGLCGRELLNLEAKGLFPKRFTITPNGRVVGWIEDEVTGWIKERAAQRGPA